jgi:hypothetical protein
MTILTRNPANPNLLHPNKFQLNFSRLPNMQYFCQSVAVPGISMSEAIQPTPFIDVYAPGEKAIYDLLTVTFLVDEELKSWLEIHDWIRAMTFPEKFEEYQQLSRLSRKAGNPEKPQYSDGTLTILSSANNPTCRFKFHDIFPISLSTFVVNTQDTPDAIITADVTFRFTYYDVELV